MRDSIPSKQSNCDQAYVAAAKRAAILDHEAARMLPLEALQVEYSLRCRTHYCRTSTLTRMV
jgi:hypothetical protein